ncbi:MAG: SLBB domain-containing protein [Candidatus Kapabacteria bacterium]|nr:SLBB domain-containing protein [Candidatus Kapabacteria bacterium]
MKLIIMFVLLNLNLFAQVTGGSDLKEMMKDDFESKASADKLLKLDNLPIGNDIDPNFYIVGSGDILSIRVLPQSVNSQLMQISPDGSILLPRSAGIISLKGMTLKQAIEAISNKILEINPKATVNIVLAQSRVCLISIAGNINQPGTYALPSSYRVSTVLNYISQVQNQTTNSSQMLAQQFLKQEANSQRNKLFSENGIAPNSNSTYRNILVSHKDGSANNVDIEKAQALNDVSYDPYIREGDKIYLPYDDKYYTMISISGAVIRPFSTIFKEGDKAGMLLKFAYGLKENADLSNIELVYSDGRKVKLSIDKSLKILGEDYLLEAGSSIIVGQKTYSKNLTKGFVSLKGQIKNEGVVSIENNETKLKEVVESAGGVLEDADLANSYILRKDDSRGENFYVACNVEDAILNNSENDNVKLQSGDVIVVPRKQNKVYIYGRVNKPGYIEYDKSKPYEWYISKAGGFSNNAQKNRARIIRGITNNWIEPNPDVKIKDGDKIYVPAPPDIPQQVSDAKYGMIAGVLGATASILFLFINIYNSFIK